jgi:16S rRNA G966 N2-methylase RsmD
MMRAILKRCIKSIVEKGPKRTFQSIISVIEDLLFEKKYGLNTAANIEVSNLDIKSKDKAHFTCYQPTRVRHFRKLMEFLNLPASNVFVDFGAGKGRVLILASMYNFKRVVGVEISSKLCKTAKDNIAFYKTRSKMSVDVQVVESDVLLYRITDDENVFFFFNPFDSYIMEKILEKIMISLKNTPREAWIIINNSQYDDLIEREKFEIIEEFKYGGTEFTVIRIPYPADDTLHLNN